MVRIGPVVQQALPHTTRALGDVGMTRPLVVHLEVAVGAVAEEVRPARTEVGESRYVLLRRRGRRRMHVDRGHKHTSAGYELMVCSRRLERTREFTSATPGLMAPGLSGAIVSRGARLTR